MVRLENIGLVRRGLEGKEVRILSDISFTARPMEITAIVGPSGGGKSSLLRLVNRLEDPTSGWIWLDGEKVTFIDPLQLRRRVAMVLQKPFMFDGTVLSNLQRPFSYRNGPLPGALGEEVLNSLDLSRLSPDLLERDGRTLSLGQQQRVSLARALITRPQVLLLDEPTSSLDRPTADHLAATLQEVCRAKRLTVIMATHDLRLAGRIANYLIYLEGGRILEEGNTEELLTRPKTAELTRFLAEPGE